MIKMIGAQGSFLHVTLRWKFQSQGCQRFLRNEDILPYEKNITIWIYGPQIWQFLRDFGQILDENVENSKYTKITKKCRDAIVDSPQIGQISAFQIILILSYFHFR